MHHQIQKNKITTPLKPAVTIAPLLLSLISTPLLAGSATTTLNVSATISGNSCSFIVDSLNFGNYQGAELTASANVSIDCGGENIHWGLTTTDGGNSGDVNNRYMLGASTSNQLNYQIYTDAAHTIAYNGSALFADGDRFDATLFYGVIPAGQALVADNYSDTIVINLSF